LTLSLKIPVVKASPGWLSGWDKRVKITIDHNDIDSDLSDFPILIHISASSGRGPDDVTFVFDELDAGGGQGSYPNRKRIAVTKSDGTTQLFVEIERWDDGASGNEKAWLWVKVSGTNSISSSADTDLYLYYDNSQSDNTVYVGDAGGRTEVWDSSFKGVWHLGETTGGSGAIKDSTSNNNDGTDSGSPTLGATGQIDSAIDFDGSDDYVSVPHSGSLDITGDMTLELWLKYDTSSDWDYFVGKGSDGAADVNYCLQWDWSGPAYRFDYTDSSGVWGGGPASSSLTVDTWYHMAVTYISSTRQYSFYLSGSADGGATGSVVMDTTSYGLGIASDGVGNTAYCFDGAIDEVRLSNTARSAAWIKATHESGRDDLLDFGSEENPEVDTYDSDYSTPKDTYSIGETVYAKGIDLEAGNYDFKYFKTGEGSPRGSELNVAEDPLGEWQSHYDLLSGDPTGDWEVRVFDAGTSTLRCSAPFTVQAVSEFPYGAMAALVTCSAIYLAKRKTLER